ncbi:MAG: phosphohydrolase [Candidatus Magasanikbacteria bacterium CG10_big_fil_rev_8_21_14_0_10_36_32]|uniref:Phosphohydrolase n=1 Tax=Candidatus Magasanikbacteria bacterium CG10_big_fil_rev_8_21_14_0_10_36_32 TaxID=1974646 RepID=A0A2M6W7I6_9BACT|nr:MAG: phosphohydrolase [Candidatus Magasanikbacteria bacterium CG10_big_fil_rev_8_21_14_0_10_36_32]
MVPGLIEKAVRLATLAHAGQKRKGDNLPYIIHPMMVALKLAKYGASDEVIAAALTHDVLEDTDVPVEKLKEELGEEVLTIVQAVSNDDSLGWLEKKKHYIETVKNGPAGAKAVALADKIHNLESILIAYSEQGKDVWKKFNGTKEQKIWFETEMLNMLKSTFEHPLIAEYERLIGEEGKLD